MKLLLLLLTSVLVGSVNAKTDSPDEALAKALEIATNKIDCNGDAGLCSPSVSRLRCTRASIESSRHCEFTDSAGKTQRVFGRKAGPLFEALRHHPGLAAYCQKAYCNKVIELEELSCTSSHENASIKTTCAFKMNSAATNPAAPSAHGPVQLITPGEAAMPGEGAK